MVGRYDVVYCQSTIKFGLYAREVDTEHAVSCAVRSESFSIGIDEQDLFMARDVTVDAYDDRCVTLRYENGDTIAHDQLGMPQVGLLKEVSLRVGFQRMTIDAPQVLHELHPHPFIVLIPVHDVAFGIGEGFCVEVVQ